MIQRETIMTTNTYIVCSDTNYDLMVHVVNADIESEALAMAKSGVDSNGNKINKAWNGCQVYKIPTDKRGVVFCDADGR